MKVKGDGNLVVRIKKYLISEGKKIDIKHI